MDHKINLNVDYDLPDPALPYKRLWTMVLIQAIKDTKSRNKLIRESAFYWITRDEKGFNSFLNVCDILNADAKKIRRIYIK